MDDPATSESRMPASEAHAAWFAAAEAGDVEKMEVLLSGGGVTIDADTPFPAPPPGCAARACDPVPSGTG